MDGVYATFALVVSTLVAVMQVAGDAAAQVSTAGGEVVRGTTTGDVSLNVVIGYVVIHVIEWIKNLEIKGTQWFTHASPAWVQRLVGAAGALVAALGIQYSFDSSTGTLVITGLVITSIVNLGWEWIKQYIAQQLMYRIALAPRIPTSAPSHILT